MECDGRRETYRLCYEATFGDHTASAPAADAEDARRQLAEAREATPGSADRWHVRRTVEVITRLDW